MHLSVKDNKTKTADNLKGADNNSGALKVRYEHLVVLYSQPYLIKTIFSVRLRVNFHFHHHRVRTRNVAEHFLASYFAQSLVCHALNS